MQQIIQLRFHLTVIEFLKSFPDLPESVVVLFPVVFSGQFQDLILTVF